MKDPIKEIEERLKRGYISNGLTMMVYNQEQIWEDMANLLKLVKAYEVKLAMAISSSHVGHIINTKEVLDEIKKEIFGDK